MEERSNKTIMCSVLFLDISEYSKRSVAGQISLKERFNGYLSAAIRNVPMADRIILDTGDGAAINFLGDVEDALKAALSLRESVLNEAPDLDPPLLIRAGINLGPVRLVRDINGQPNIVGDGINVAQRVMGFAEAGQILVSRSYYDAVSRLSPQYAEMFHYQGSRTDKHVREHEVYAIGYPGDKTARLAAGGEGVGVSGGHADMLGRIRLGWHWAAAKLGAVAGGLIDRFKQADPKRRALYAALAALPVLLIGILALKLAHTGKPPVLPGADRVQAESGVQPEPAVVPATPAAPRTESKVTGAAETPAAAKPAAKKGAESKADGKKAAGQAKAVQPKAKAAEPVRKGAAPAGAESGAGHPAGTSYVSLVCKEGTQLFVDGALKGRVAEKELIVAIPSGKHTVIASSVSGALYTQNIELEPGKTVHIRPNFCD